MKAIVDQFPADLTEDLAGVFPNLWEATKMGRINAILGGRLNGTIGQGSKEPVYYVNKLVTKFAARLRVEIKIHRDPTITKGQKAVYRVFQVGRSRSAPRHRHTVLQMFAI